MLLLSDVEFIRMFCSYVCTPVSDGEYGLNKLIVEYKAHIFRPRKDTMDRITDASRKKAIDEANAMFD